MARKNSLSEKEAFASSCERCRRLEEMLEAASKSFKFDKLLVRSER